MFVCSLGFLFVFVWDLFIYRGGGSVWVFFKGFLFCFILFCLFLFDVVGFLSQFCINIVTCISRRVHSQFDYVKPDRHKRNLLHITSIGKSTS